MVYSLVNVPTLIRDVARLPSGPALVGDLLQAFALTPPDLEVLAARAPVRADARTPRAFALAPVAAGGSASAATVTIGDLDDLIRFVRREVLAAAWSGDADLAVATHPAALDVVTDGLTATYDGRHDIGNEWRRWCADHPDPPGASAYPLILDAVRRLPRGAARTVVVPAEWAESMHEACWAVHLSGRERTAAVTQLSALQVLFDVVGPAAPSPSLVATVVAAVHACVGSDLLAAEVYDALTQPFFSLLV